MVLGCLRDTLKKSIYASESKMLKPLLAFGVLLCVTDSLVLESNNTELINENNSTDAEISTVIEGNHRCPGILKFTYQTRNEAYKEKSFVNKRTYFKLWTEENPEIPEIKIFENNQLVFEKYNPERKTIILVHGYFNLSSDYVDEYFENLRQGLMKTGENYNVIGVDWLNVLSRRSFDDIPEVAALVGKHIAKGIKDLRSLNPCKNKTRMKCQAKSYFFIIAHEIGAFVAGNVGADFKVDKINRILGLAPVLINIPKANNLENTSAELVEVVHTVLCEKPPPNLSHRSFYLNSGVYPQPDCGEDKQAFCSLRKAYINYVKSMTDSANPFKGVLCPSYTEYVNNICRTYPTLSMYNLRKIHETSEGNYYIGKTDNENLKFII